MAGKGEPWPQAIIGPLSNAIASAHALDGESGFAGDAILIGTNSRIAAKDLYTLHIAEVDAAALECN
jgi:hypothetical protein